MGLNGFRIIFVGYNAAAAAGVSMIADSVPRNEYEETCNKAKALLNAVELAEAGLDWSVSAEN